MVGMAGFEPYVACECSLFNGRHDVESAHWQSHSIWTNSCAFFVRGQLLVADI